MSNSFTGHCFLKSKFAIWFGNFWNFVDMLKCIVKLCHDNSGLCKWMKISFSLIFEWIVHCVHVKHISHIDNETKFLFIHLHTRESSWHSLTMHLRMSTKCQKITTSNMQMKFPTQILRPRNSVQWMNLTQIHSITKCMSNFFTNKISNKLLGNCWNGPRTHLGPWLKVPEKFGP